MIKRMIRGLARYVGGHASPMILCVGVDEADAVGIGLDIGGTVGGPE
jgi:hypothetical protein